MGEMEYELERLHQCLLEPEKVHSAELVCEKIAFDAFAGKYNWNGETLTAHRTLASGTEFRIGSIRDDAVIELVITFGAQGFEARKNVTKYLPKDTLSV